MSTHTSAHLFDTVLVANRGEIAVRIMSTLRRLGIRSVAVYSDADRHAPHVAAADVAVRLGPAAASESYLHIERLLDAALAAGADAVHPGYGFVSENAGFARACAGAGLVFVGPPADAIEAMGDKIRAKQTVMAAGVSVVPGRADPFLSDADLREAAIEVGFPVLLKPSAGGGGKGMRRVDDPGGLDDAIAAARREAAGAFGDDTLFVERFVSSPRHIEIQVLLDVHGGAVHLGERECSLQRRHQKIVEEAPSVLLTPEVRDRIGEQALAAARACGYTNAGTVEFIVSADRPDEPFFMEMNTRLQVEHPVTEMVWGLDLVEQQLRIAAGQPLGFAQSDLAPTGHAVEVRIYAEDPAIGFVPSPGRLEAFDVPESSPHVRVDAGVVAGQTVGSEYDPMLAKVIAWAPTRDVALTRLRAALAEVHVAGLVTNVGFLRRLLAVDEVVSGALDTGLVEARLDELVDRPVDIDALVVAALAVDRERSLALDPADPWNRRDGWRVGDRAWTAWRAAVHGADTVVTVRTRPLGDVIAPIPTGSGMSSIAPARSATYQNGVAAGSVAQVEGQAEARLDDGEPIVCEMFALGAGDGGRSGPVDVIVDGRHWRGRITHVGDSVWITGPDGTWRFTEHDAVRTGRSGTAPVEGVLRSPMPGTVVAVNVADGDQVSAGDVIVSVEAMKMEHALRAPFDGVVSEIASVGTAVELGATLAVVTPNDEEATS